MPIYVYAPKDRSCTACCDGIERLQRLSDPPLTACPDCGAPLERIIAASSVVAGQSQRLHESHLAKHGFTQYKRIGKGQYEKTVGKGPNTISGD